MTSKFINGDGLSEVLNMLSNDINNGFNKMSSYVSSIAENSYNAIKITYADLVSRRNLNELIPGQYYQIIDYVTTSSDENTMCANNYFDVVVLALDENSLSEEAYAVHSVRSDYFTTSNLNAWKLWYCLDNDTSRFSWAGTIKKVPRLSISISGGGHWLRNEDLVLENSDTTYYGYEWVGGSDGTDSYKVIWFTQEYISETSDPIETTFFYIPEGTNEMVPLNVTINNITFEDVEMGKGVIYRMIDEFGNDCPYDFKNIMFKNPLDTTDENYYFTFSDTSNGEIKDATISQITKGVSGKCNNNTIGYYLSVTGDLYVYPYNIPKNIFKNENFYFVNNTLGNNCYNNLFVSSYCTNNTFGNGCYHNTFDSPCRGNTLGHNCYGNNFKSGRYNTLGNNCYSNNFFGGECNILGDNCALNDFGIFGTSNILGPYCSGNTFGAACAYNTLGPDCSHNVLGDHFYNNTFGSSSNYNTFVWKSSAVDAPTALKYMSKCYFPDGYSYNELIHYKSSNDDSTMALQNVHFGRGLYGTSTSVNTITIESPTSADYETKVSKNSEGEIKVYCEADLIASSQSAVPRIKTRVGALSELLPNVVYDNNESTPILNIPPFANGDSDVVNKWIVRSNVLEGCEIKYPTDIRWKNGTPPTYTGVKLLELIFTEDSLNDILGEWNVY